MAKKRLTKTQKLEQDLELYKELLMKRDELVHRLQENGEHSFLNSPTYIQLQERIRFLEGSAKLSEIGRANAEGRWNRYSDYDRKLYEDNKAFLEHDGKSDYFVELHGDRYYRDDPAIIGGIAYFQGICVTVIAQAKGRTTKENLERNFAMPSPEGYRKARRLMKQAEKFHRPVINFVDTPGAFCGMEAEERGQGEAIARNLFELSGLKVPVLSVVIGEGGSGGALALAVADEVWMLENSVYSVLSPEGFASILWKDSSRSVEAAKMMKLTAADLKKLGVIERVFPEPQNFSVLTMKPTAELLRAGLAEFLTKYQKLETKDLLEGRYERFRKL